MLGCSQSPHDVTTANLWLVKNVVEFQKLDQELRVSYEPTLIRWSVVDTWDAGYYQLKNLWKEYLPEDFKRFREMFKQFGNELIPLVYELGFLRK